jgi:hypothetical protein
MNFEGKTNFGPTLFNLDWWEPTKKKWAPVLLDANKPFWKNEREPDGKPWKKLSPAYGAWKKKNFGPSSILRLTGQMQDTARIRVDLKNDKFFVETTTLGIYHQFGTSKMSARPWMHVPDTSLSKLSAISWKHILKKS